MNNFLPFSLPDIGEEEINEVVDSLRSGWITTGPKAKRFEEDFQAYLGGGVGAIAVNSATSGLHLALEALGVTEGDEVIVPTYTFTATAEVVRYLGATPIFVDSEVDTLNIDPQLIEAAITKRTKAIVPVHFAGLPCNMNSIFSIAKKYGLRIVEDAAHAFPAKYEGNLVGTLGSDVTVFSFYANKTMTTAEGGMLVSANEDILARARVMRLHGISKDAFDRYQSKKPSWYYEVIEPGFKYNMPDICAAIGIHQLKKIDKFKARRALMANRYTEALSDLPVILPNNGKDVLGTEHAWHLYTIRLSECAGLSRDKFIELMMKEGLGCSVHFIPLHKHPIWRNTYQLTNEQFPVADKAYSSIVSIPFFTKMSDEDQIRVIITMRNILE